MTNAPIHRAAAHAAADRHPRHVRMHGSVPRPRLPGSARAPRHPRRRRPSFLKQPATCSPATTCAGAPEKSPTRWAARWCTSATTSSSSRKPWPSRPESSAISSPGTMTTPRRLGSSSRAPIRKFSVRRYSVHAASEWLDRQVELDRGGRSGPRSRPLRCSRTAWQRTRLKVLHPLLAEDFIDELRCLALLG